MSGPATLPLWTEQAQNFVPTSGRYDRSLSPYRNDSPIMAAYDALFAYLGSDQFVWCSQSPPTREDLNRARLKRMVYLSLVVPFGAIRFVDNVLWQAMIEGNPHKRWKPEDDRQRLRTEAYHQSISGTDEDIDERERRLVEAYWSNIGVARPVESLIVPGPLPNDRTVALVSFPLDAAWLRIEK